MYSTDRYFNGSNRNIKYWISLYEEGHVFDGLLYNKVSIFMTHVPNFTGDRLAIFLFENLFRLISSWTNLKFYTLSPLEIVKKYFEYNPDDKEPRWRNPCSKNEKLRYKNVTECERLPKLIIAGPRFSGKVHKKN